MITLENDQYTATINPDGAELTSLIRKADHRQAIWTDDDGQYWQRHAPVLFPAIGRSNQNQYSVNGTLYPMPQHGFARDMHFLVTEHLSEAAVTLTLAATDQTRTQYPFDFSLGMTYRLTPTGIAITATVTNHDDTAMPFAFGLHPGFALSQPMTDYSVTLTGATTPLKRLVIDPLPFRSGAVTDLEEAKGGRLDLSDERLSHGIILIDAQNATAVTLESATNQESVTLSLTDFPYLGIWSPPGKHAPFVCLEPFHGLPDLAGAPSDWHKKEGNTILAPNQTCQLNLAIDLT